MTDAPEAARINPISRLINHDHTFVPQGEELNFCNVCGYSRRLHDDYQREREAQNQDLNPYA